MRRWRSKTRNKEVEGCRRKEFRGGNRYQNRLRWTLPPSGEFIINIYINTPIISVI
jgi:hypothetical protein